tara:strand:- start:150 stop:557 length:408 start_codon:yes stop_codon:yes gene_type:complete
MNFTDAVKAYFLKWNDFRSRSSRSEYWWATLFVTLASFPVGYIIGFVIAILSLTAGFSETTMEIVVGIVMLPIQIFIIIASTCLVIRRLHDVDKSGWWYLIIFTIIGIIPLLIWYCSKGTNGDNRFGKDPLEQLQ